MSGAASHRLLRWYPTAWRARYGDELVALMEDTYGVGRVPLRQRVALARAGVTERLHQVGTGEQSPADRVRSGSLWVLCGWAFFVVGGAAFAKLSEHWDQSTPFAERHVPAIGYNAVVAAACVGTLVVLAGAALALPACIRLLRRGGWSQVRGPILVAAGAVAVTTAYSVGVALWSLHVGPHHGGPTGSARAVGVVWAVLVSATVAALTGAAVAVSRRLPLTRRVLVAEVALALALAVAMVVVLAGTALWWGATARDTTIFSGGGSGLFATSAWLSMSAAALLMTVGLLVAAAGVVRIARSWPASHRAS